MNEPRLCYVDFGKEKMNRIPDEMSSKFNAAEGRKALICAYSDSKFPFAGKDEDGCTVTASISKDGLVLNTFQNNGWVRVNYYNSNGAQEGETFDGKWK